MRLELPRESERFGAVIFHGLQKIYELDSGMMAAGAETANDAVIQHVPYEKLYEIEQDMAIVVPARSERLKLLQGVLCGIPHPCLVIVVSNSPRAPIDRFALEVDSIETFSKFTNKNVVVVHQRDPAIAEAFQQAKYPRILSGKKHLVRDGKAEGMIIGMMLARLAGKKYVGFVDADNYFPGAVLEYVHEFAAGFATCKSKNTMIRIVWHSKPKVVESSLFFAKSGRVSTITNRYFNSLIGHYSGFETEVIKTGNAGEHAMTMDLAMQLSYASGYAIEPFELIYMMERFGAVIDDLDSDFIRQHVEVFQIESRNPHLHDVKGDEHIDHMVHSSLGALFHSPLCPATLKEEIVAELRTRALLDEKRNPPRPFCYPPLSCLDLKAFGRALKDESLMGLPRAS